MKANKCLSIHKINTLNLNLCQKVNRTQYNFWHNLYLPPEATGPLYSGFEQNLNSSLTSPCLISGGGFGPDRSGCFPPPSSPASATGCKADGRGGVGHCRPYRVIGRLKITHILSKVCVLLK